MPHQHWSQHFLAIFEEIKRKTNNRPANLEHAVKLDANLSALNRELVWVVVPRIMRRLTTSKHKLATHVDRHFPEAFKSYQSVWTDSCHAAAWLDITAEEILADISTVSDKSGSSLPLVKSDDIYWAEFDPEFDSAAEYFGRLITHLQDVFDDDQHSHFATQDWLDFLSQGLGAWNWLCGSVGLSIEDVEARWRKVPFTFVPAHVSNSYGYEEAGSLYDLLHEATRAYVFGAPLAAIALCRSLTELLLRKHYLTEPAGDLEAMITVAEKQPRLAWLKRENLQEKRRLANNILHRGNPSAPLSGSEDEAVRNWFETLKRMIEKAPVID